MDDPANLFKDYFDAEKRQDVKAQEAAAGKIWQYLAETRDDEPSPWLAAMERAHDCEAAFDWAGAESAYRHAIHVSADKPGLQSSAHNHLRMLFLLLGKEDLALDAARAATETARLTKMAPVLSAALVTEAYLHLQRNDLPQARALLSEALDLTEKESVANVVRANALTLRAECFFCEGKLPEMEADLAAAWQLLEAHREATFAGGWQFGLAIWWSLTARSRHGQGRLEAAADAWREAVARRRIVAELPQIEGPYKRNALAMALRELGKCLEELADASAEECFAESDAIRRAIGVPVLER